MIRAYPRSRDATFQEICSQKSYFVFKFLQLYYFQLVLQYFCQKLPLFQDFVKSTGSWVILSHCVATLHTDHNPTSLQREWGCDRIKGVMRKKCVGRGMVREPLAIQLRDSSNTDLTHSWKAQLVDDHNGAGDICKVCPRSLLNFAWVRGMASDFLRDFILSTFQPFLKI